MNTTKVLVGGIVGGIAYFLLGWLIYGMLLMNYMSQNSVAGVMRPQDEMIWWSLILSNLIFGFLISYILNQVGRISKISKGASIAGVVGLLASAGYDLGMYATSNVSTLNAILADVAAFTVMSFIVGAIIVVVCKRIK